MATEELGKLLLNTQKDLKVLKNEIELFQSPYKATSADEYKYMLEKIKEHLNKFEDKIQGKVGHVVSSSHGQKLPPIGQDTLSSKQDTLQSEGSKTFNRTAKSANKSVDHKTDVTKDPRFNHLAKLIQNPNSSLTQSLLKSKYAIPQPQKIEEKPKVVEKKAPITGRVAKPTKILPKAIREDPFAVAPINENDVKQGLMTLISRRMVPKDVDLTPAFERQMPILSHKKASMHDFKERFNPSDPHPQLPSYIYNARLDFKTFERTEIPQDTLKIPAYYNLAFADQLKASQPQSNQVGSPITKEKFNPKDYDEVVDAYSLHQFIIRKGRTLTETPEFQSYKRTFFGIWDSIENIILHMERLLSDYDIKVAYIDGKKLARLAESTYTKPRPEEILSCIVNVDEVTKVIKIPQNMFKGANGKHLAAIKIQSLWRMFKAKKSYKIVKNYFLKISVIQKCAKIFLKYRGTQKMIDKRKQEYYQHCQNLNMKLIEDWPKIKDQPRIEVHINSLGYEEAQRLSVDKIIQKQGTQLSRIFAIKDPNVHVIYIAPYEMPVEIISYYTKVLELGGIENASSKFTILFPDNHLNFPKHLPTTKTLLYSPRTIKKIREIIKGKPAYIVPGVPSQDDAELSAILDIPLFSGDPLLNAKYSLKSGAKEIFHLTDLPVPAGSYNIFSEKDLIMDLSRLIAYNLSTNTWIFKINNEFGGRGIAWFQIDGIKPLMDLRKKSPPVSEELVLKIQDIVNTILPHKMKFAMQHIYKNYSDYVNKFSSKGGVIEAAPNCNYAQLASTSISFLIDPVGDVSVTGCFDRFFAQEYVCAGYFFPQKSIPNINMLQLSQTIGKQLYEKGIFGYVNVDIITFPDPSKSPSKNQANDGEDKTPRLFWVVDLDCHLTNSQTAAFFFDFLMRGSFDQATGAYKIKRIIPVNHEDQTPQIQGAEVFEETTEKRCFMYCPFIYHPGLTNIAYKTFFHLCRLKSISYDLENKVGTAFGLIDSLQIGVLGILTIGRYRRNSVKYMNDTLDFIMNQAGNIEYKIQMEGESRSDAMYISEIVSRVKMIHKVFEKKQKYKNGF